MSYQGMQQHKAVKRQEQLEYHEGKSPAAWAGSWISLAAFVILTYTSTFGFEQFGWMGVIVPSVIILLAGVLTLVMKAQGYGTPARDL
ncbi:MULTISPECIES: hypothetical protein [unclassified Luteococcus]|uniref:hypothetical protein n=1 Tax=unclassified Luteococcus TaxID=2639923 RepID=UPI00313BFAF0